MIKSESAQRMRCAIDLPAFENVMPPAVTPARTDSAESSFLAYPFFLKDLTDFVDVAFRDGFLVFESPTSVPTTVPLLILETLPTSEIADDFF